MFNPLDQYRCTIIRGKALRDIEDLLPAYAGIINSLCPTQKQGFAESFNRAIARVISITTKKTLDNHRTEITRKLFGMWYEDVSGHIHAAMRTLNFFQSKDTPAFFKDLVSRIQFPNGMDKIQTVQDRIAHKINFRPVHFILKLLLVAEDKKEVLTRREIAYYVLNCLPVLQGKISANEVLEVILTDRANGLFRKVEAEGKASSYLRQHIVELINMIELANLIRQVKTNPDTFIYLNKHEGSVIKYFAELGETKPTFDAYKYNLEDPDQKELFYRDWEQYYTTSDSKASEFATSASSILNAQVPERGSSIPGLDTAAIGEEGEKIVLEKEKSRVKEFNARLVNKVIYFGKQKGLGYDISSLIAVRGPTAEHAIYIEVKSTKRITKPREPFSDQFDLTRNEWVAAEQHGKNYYIYRVYLTNEGVSVVIIQDPVQLKKEGLLYAEPTRYHVEFDHKSGKLSEWTN